MSVKIVATNRKARFNYDIKEKYEAGIELKGTEVKSIRKGKINITDGYASIDNIERDGDTLKVTISNAVEYAKYVEYGHMDRGHKKWVDGKFMCSLSIIEVKKKMPKRFQKEFETWFASFNM